MYIKLCMYIHVQYIHVVILFPHMLSELQSHMMDLEGKDQRRAVILASVLERTARMTQERMAGPVHLPPSGPSLPRCVHQLDWFVPGFGVIRDMTELTVVALAQSLVMMILVVFVTVKLMIHRSSSAPDILPERVPMALAATEDKHKEVLLHTKTTKPWTTGTARKTKQKKKPKKVICLSSTSSHTIK